jgi:protein-S-isoprenylcysteine O-methyltransferase Ste14
VTEAQSKHGGARVRLPPPLVFSGLIGVGVVVQLWVWPLSLPLAFWPRVIGGGALALAGLLVGIPAIVWFRRTGQDPAPWKPSPELIVRGIYRYTRNPMYVGMTLLQLGIGGLAGNPWILALAPVALILVHFAAVRPEERYLTEKFGESYLRYKKSVRRYV